MSEILIKTENGFNLKVVTTTSAEQLEITIEIDYAENVMFHWGLFKHDNPSWHIQDESSLPKGSTLYKNKAVQSPFISKDGKGILKIKITNYKDFSFIPFALYFPDTGIWDSNNGQNYLITIPIWKKTEKDPLNYFKSKLTDIIYEGQYHIARYGDVCAIVTLKDNNLHLKIATDIEGHMILHWGVIGLYKSQWQLPSDSIKPSNTTSVCGSSIETLFIDEDNYKTLSIIAPADQAPNRVAFVLRKDYDQWLKNNNYDFIIPFGALVQKDAPMEQGDVKQITAEIIEREMSRNSWTLMHRFNLCHDLINRSGDNIESLAYLFVWLRFSQMRQLDWQRNYNTQPRELAHSMDRLTLRIAWLYIDMPKTRPIARLMLSTLGPGGDGQRIRDEILQIMHRHRIKEVSGSFLEEWHQKLHNNTTPDDVVICEAFLAYLKSNGNLETFYNTLNNGGVTKKRLETFERPIKTPPDFVHYLKDALIHDFEFFLSILKKVHVGSDLQSSIEASGYILSDYIKGRLWFLFDNRLNHSMPIEDQIGTVFFIRKNLYDILNNDRDSLRVRTIIFLDVALMEYARKVIEGRINKDFHIDTLLKLLGLTLDNWMLSNSSPALIECKRHLDKLYAQSLSSYDMALHTYSLIGKISRLAAGEIDSLVILLQKKSEYLGKVFEADGWTINLFAEEIARGQLEFIVSLIIKYLEPKLREMADLGSWQVIGQGAASGKVCVVTSLKELHNSDKTDSLIVIADRVLGDEEPPEGVTAIITQESVDIVSHLAIRARNRKIVFVVCYCPEIFNDLKSKTYISIENDSKGGVIITDDLKKDSNSTITNKTISIKRRYPSFKSYVLSESEFTDELVGGKALNLKSLQGKTPKWINLPKSIAIPFGVFEHILDDKINTDIKKKYLNLADNSNRFDTNHCRQLRDTILGLNVPSELMDSLKSMLKTTGLTSKTGSDNHWLSIKKVFASIWNDRAYQGRIAFGIKHSDISMAVLIQEVIDAQYAFVIHTNNPITGNKEEVYAEIVVGLGETLVGNYPGTSLGFKFNKSDKSIKIVSYPNKEIGLYGQGLIFRSDSNAEDLTGYSGAGLYDSITESLPVSSVINYSDERLLWDIDFRTDLMTKIAEIGIIIEEIFGKAQDIEGVYSGEQFYVVQSRPQIS